MMVVPPWGSQRLGSMLRRADRVEVGPVVAAGSSSSASPRAPSGLERRSGPRCPSRSVRRRWWRLRRGSRRMRQARSPPAARANEAVTWSPFAIVLLGPHGSSGGGSSVPGAATSGRRPQGWGRRRRGCALPRSRCSGRGNRDFGRRTGGSRSCACSPARRVAGCTCRIACASGQSRGRGSGQPAAGRRFDGCCGARRRFAWACAGRLCGSQRRALAGRRLEQPPVASRRGSEEPSVAVSRCSA